MAKDQPFSCSIEGDELVIRMGIDAMAQCLPFAPRFYDYEKHSKQPMGTPYFKVTDNRLFAEAVARELNRDDEDGSTPMHDLLDAAAARAVDDGCEGVEHDEDDSEAHA